MIERRQAPRYMTETRARLTHLGSKDPLPVTVTTLSVQGCCVKGSGLPAAGQDCQLTISWQGREIRVNAKVAWKQPQGQVGLRFLSLDQESTDNLRGLCSTLKLQPLARMTYDE